MTYRFRINLRSGDIEFEGSEDFVKEQIANLPKTLKSISENLPALTMQSNEPSRKEDPITVPDDDPSPAIMSPAVTSNAEVSSSFGEWIHQFPSDISDQDKALVAGMFVQNGSEKNDFKTAEINGVLKEHGFKLANPSRALGRLVSQKYLFQTRKEGKLKFLRVSKIGETRIAELRAGDS